MNGSLMQVFHGGVRDGGHKMYPVNNGECLVCLFFAWLASPWCQAATRAAVTGATDASIGQYLNRR